MGFTTVFPNGFRVIVLETVYNSCITVERVYNSWKTARLTPIFKKEDETDRENYRPVSILSVPSKILESEVNDTIVDHVYQHNNLISDEQWAYRRGYSTELLLSHLTEMRRKAVHSGLVVGVACAESKKTFDSVSHAIFAILEE